MSKKSKILLLTIILAGCNNQMNKKAPLIPMEDFLEIRINQVFKYLQMGNILRT